MKHKSARTRRIFGLGMLGLISIMAAVAVMNPITVIDSIIAVFTGVSVMGALAAVPLFGNIHLDPGSGGGGETPEQKAKRLLFDEIKAAVKKDLDAFRETDEFNGLLALKAAYDGLKAKLESATKAEDIDTIKSELSAAILDIKALKEAKVTGGPKKGSLLDTIMQHKEKLIALKENKSGSVTFEHKATHTSTDIDNRDDFFTWHDGGRVGHIPVRLPFMRELFRNQNTETEYIKYLDQKTVVRDAKNVALCAASTHNTKTTFETRTLQIQKIRDFTHVCLDMMSDYTFVEGEIRRLLDESLKLKADNDLLLGDGSAPNLTGIDSIASTFSATNADPEADYSQAVVVPASSGNANLIDLFSIAAAQIRTFGSNNKFNPGAVLLNPRDHQMIKLLKDNQNNYIMKPGLIQTLFVDSAGRWFIDGMLLVPNSLIPQNEAYIGDFRMGTVYAKPGFGVEFSFENRENFEQELVTAKVYERLNLLVRNVDANAFMHISDLAQARFDITAGT